METEIPNRRRRLFKNSLYGLFSWLFPIFPTLIVTPILIKSLGSEIYGLYIIILGFVSYFFTAGLGKVGAKYVAEYRATGETEKISDIISATIILSVSLSLAGTAAIAIFARILVSDILVIPPDLQDTAVTALYLACAVIMAGTMSLIFQMLLQGLQRFDRFLLVTNLGSLLLSLGSIAIVFFGWGILAILVWTLAVTVSIAILSYMFATKLLPEFEFRIRIKTEAWKNVRSYGTSIILYQLCGGLLLLFERAWIVRKFGTGPLTFYAVPMTLAMYIHLFTGSLVLSLFPALNELLAEREKLITLYQKSTKFILMLIVFAVISVIAGGRLFLSQWMSPDFADASYLLLIIHVFTFALLATNTIAWQVAESFKAAGVNAFAAFAWMVMSIPLMIILSETLQSKGVAFARFAGVLVFVPMIFYVEKRYLGRIFWQFWGFSVKRITIAAIPAFLAEYFIVAAFRPSWFTFLLSVLTGFVIYGSILYISGFFEADEKQLVKDLIIKF